MTSSRPIATIDLGSNTLKVLVARADARGQVESLAERVLEVRLGGGSPAADGTPLIGADAIRAGAEACAGLVAIARQHDAHPIVIVATAAVRAAGNQQAFAEAILAATGIPLRILSGEEEAILVGRGLRTDPALAGVPRLVQGDLGGGSLELVDHGPRGTEAGISLPLGAVRTTRTFVAQPCLPWSPDVLAALRTHATSTLRGSGFTFHSGVPLVATGGGVTAASALLDGARTLGRAELDRLARELAALDFEARIARGVSPGRADIIPAAFATMAALAEVAGVETLSTSFRNLRWGLAAAVLDGSATAMGLNIDAG